MRRITLCLAVLLLTAFGHEAALAKRVALVIGNNSYDNLDDLHKAVNDARAMVGVLEAMDFDIVTGENLTRRETNFKLSEFENLLGPGDEAFVFFAGHGVAVGGENYLLPRDMPKPRIGEEGLVADEGHAVGALVERVKARGARTSFFVLDACRDNPFGGQGTRSTVGATRGMTRIDAPQGVFLLYSAGYGQTALDRLSDDDPNPNSIFTRKLLPILQTPGLSHVDIAKQVQVEVSDLAQSVRHQQQPAYYDQIIGEAVLLPAAATAAEAAGSSTSGLIGATGPIDPNNLPKLSIDPDAASDLPKISIDPAVVVAIAKLRADAEAAANRASQDTTLEDTRARGTLSCGVQVNNATPGFGRTGLLGWRGFDVDFCRAVSSAVLRDQTAIDFVPLTARSALDSLRFGEVDLLPRVFGNGFSTRVTDLSYVGTSFHDGQGFMLPKDLGVRSALELSGATVCVLPGTTQEAELANYFAANGMQYEVVAMGSQAEAAQAYFSARCDVYTADASDLASLLATSDDPDGHIILPEVITNDIYGPVVRGNADNWNAIVALVLDTLILAEEKGLTRDNVMDRLSSTSDPQFARLSGTGMDLGLPPGWAVNILRAVGNYGEIYDRNFGESTPWPLPRGANALRSSGGLMFAQTR